MSLKLYTIKSLKVKTSRFSVTFFFLWFESVWSSRFSSSSVSQTSAPPGGHRTSGCPHFVFHHSVSLLLQNKSCNRWVPGLQLMKKAGVVMGTPSWSQVLWSNIWKWTWRNWTWHFTEDTTTEGYLKFSKYHTLHQVSQQGHAHFTADWFVEWIKCFYLHWQKVQK